MTHVHQPREDSRPVARKFFTGRSNAQVLFFFGGGVEDGLLFERFAGGIKYTKTGRQKRKVDISQNFELQN